jgi:hypothetical protein
MRTWSPLSSTGAVWSRTEELICFGSELCCVRCRSCAVSHYTERSLHQAIGHLRATPWALCRPLFFPSAQTPSYGQVVALLRDRETDLRKISNANTAVFTELTPQEHACARGFCGSCRSSSDDRDQLIDRCDRRHTLERPQAELVGREPEETGVRYSDGVLTNQPGNDAI